jgi:hypothetical protein
VPKDIEQADQRQHRGTDRRRQMLIHQVGRQMNADKHHLKTADEKTKGQ